MRFLIAFSLLICLGGIHSALVNGTTAYGTRNNVIGTLDSNGTTVSRNGVVVGRVDPNNSRQILDPNDSTKVIGYLGYNDYQIAYDGAGNQIGVVDECGHVWRDGVDIGYLAGDSQTVLANGTSQTIGALRAPYYNGDSIYDSAGNRVGYVGGDSRTVYDTNGKVIGYLAADGVRVLDGNNNVISGYNRRNRTRTCGTGISGANTGNYIYNSSGQTVGYVGSDGRVYNLSNQAVGYIDTDGNTARLNNTNQVLGYRNLGATNGNTGNYVYNNGQPIGYVGTNGAIYNFNNQAIGYLDSDGNTARYYNTNQVIGYRNGSGAVGGNTGTGGIVPIGGGTGTGGIVPIGGGTGTGGIVPIGGNTGTAGTGGIVPIGGTTGAVGTGQVVPVGGIQQITPTSISQFGNIQPVGAIGSTGYYYPYGYYGK